VLGSTYKIGSKTLVDAPPSSLMDSPQVQRWR
jgi:hypothetical protein